MLCSLLTGWTFLDMPDSNFLDEAELPAQFQCMWLYLQSLTPLLHGGTIDIANQVRPQVASKGDFLSSLSIPGS